MTVPKLKIPLKTNRYDFLGALCVHWKCAKKVPVSYRSTFFGRRTGNRCVSELNELDNLEKNKSRSVINIVLFII